MKMKQVFLVMLVSAATAVLSIWGYNQLNKKDYVGSLNENGQLPNNYAKFADYEDGTPPPPPGGPVDFTAAATSATPAVVHIKTKTNARKVTAGQNRRSPFADLFGDNDMFGDFFNNQMIPEQRASGSGVLVSADGYIVTNNHVIESADEINVTLTNKKIYKATLVGADPASDLAVLKIEGSAFPYLVYGNSDDAKLGQWVLAIGYPLTLDVTVTAGIISAKSRTLNLNKASGKNSPIESFIQTDAAVNPGNSGGALVNTEGLLIGINSAIASPTGSYAGYSYAIPVNITKKIVADLMKFGTVQRAYLGITYIDESRISDEKAKEDGIKFGEGVYVSDVNPGGSAEAAGIKKGDYITKINGTQVNMASEMVDQIARFKPGDKVNVTFKRNGEEKTIEMVLKNSAGNTNVVKGSSLLEKLGGELVAMDKKKMGVLGYSGGVQVKKKGSGALAKSKMEDGFIITSVNGEEITSIEDLGKALDRAKGNVRLEGIYPGYEGTYGYPLNLNEF
jgi:serine protease Do